MTVNVAHDTFQVGFNIASDELMTGVNDIVQKSFISGHENVDFDEIAYMLFITGVNNTGDKFITGDNNTSDKLMTT